MLYYEKKFKAKGFRIIIGVDEVGRGPLAGPVVAAAVTLKKEHFLCRIDDSKKLTPPQRQTAFQEIIRNAVFGVGIINEKIIDDLNILVATSRAMEQAVATVVDKLEKEERAAAYALVDGGVKLNIDLPYSNIIKGDTKSLSIASASIVAKVIRDRIMVLYHKFYPQYGFLRHKGYPTIFHRQALIRHGPSVIHRLSFSGV